MTSSPVAPGTGDAVPNGRAADAGTPISVAMAWAAHKKAGW